MLWELKNLSKRSNQFLFLFFSDFVNIFDAIGLLALMLFHRKNMSPEKGDTLLTTGTTSPRHKGSVLDSSLAKRKQSYYTENGETVAYLKISDGLGDGPIESEGGRAETEENSVLELDVTIK